MPTYQKLYKQVIILTVTCLLIITNIKNCTSSSIATFVPIENKKSFVDLSSGIIPGKLEQKTILLKNSPNILILNDNNSIAKNYSDLNYPTLSDKDQKLWDIEKNDLAKSKHEYNGIKIHATKLSYNKDSNTITIMAFKTDYAFSKVLNRPIKSFSKDIKQKFFHLGTLAPFITDDNYTFIFERNKKVPMNFYSVAAGFLEISDGLLSNLAIKTGIIEAKEEFLNQYHNNKLIKQIDFHPPKLSAISIRTHPYFANAIEFIVPIELKLPSEEMIRIIKNNKAKDAKEHTDNFQVIDLRSSLSEIDKISTNKYSGNFLYIPSIVSLLCLNNNCQFKSHFIEIAKKTIEQAYKQIS